MRKIIPALLFLLSMAGIAYGQVQIPIVGGVVTLDPNISSTFKVFVTQQINSVILINPPSQGTRQITITVFFSQDSTGHAVIFGNNLLNAPTVSTQPNAITLVSTQFDSNTNTWVFLSTGNSQPPSGFPRWDQLLNPNIGIAPDFGGNTFTFTNGAWNLNSFNLGLPQSAGFTATANFQIGCDLTLLNCHLWNGADNVVALFPAASTFTHGDVLGVSIVAGQETLQDLAPVNASSGNTFWLVTMASPLDGDVSCWDTTGPPFVNNCTPGAVDTSIAGATSAYPITFADQLTTIDHDSAGSASVTVTLPTADTLGLNPGFVFIYSNHSTHIDTITPTTWTINGGATLPVPVNSFCRVRVDPNSATGWISDCANSAAAVSATSPIVLTAGNISCPTCGTGTGNLSGTLISGRVPVASGANALTNSSMSDDLTNTVKATDGLSVVTNSLDRQIANANPGSTTHRAVCINTSSLAITCGTTALTGVAGTADEGAGNSGNVQVCMIGQCIAEFDGNATLGNWAILSTITAGRFHDTGSTTEPTGAQAFFIYTTNSGGAGGTANVGILNPDVTSGGANGGGRGTNVQVNGTASKATLNLNGTTPAADANNQLLTFKSSASGSTTSSSVEVPLATTAQAGILQLPTSAGVMGSNSSAQAIAANQTNIDAAGYVAGGGTANAQTATLSPAITAYTNGLRVCWLPTAANSTTTPTLAVNGLTATTIVKVGGAALAANDLTTTAVACAIKDSTNFELQNPQTTTAAGITSVNAATGPALTITGVGSAGVSTSGNIITVTGINGPPSPTVNTITGTTYTVPNSDNSWRDKFTSSSAVAVTLPQANTITSSPFVATRFNTTIGSCTVCTTSAFSQSAGNYLIVFINYQNTNTISSVTDTAGDTFTLLQSPVPNSVYSDANSTYIAKSIAASGSNTITVNISGTTTMGVVVNEYTGMTDDKSAQTINPAGSSSATVTVSNPSEVAIGFVGGPGACPSGWTFRGNAGSGIIATCEKLLSGVASTTLSVVGANTSATIVDYGITGISSFTAGWYVVFENANSPLVTITPTTSTIFVDGVSKSSLQISRGRWCAVMSDGANYDAFCGGTVIGLPSAIHATGQTAAISTATLCAASPGACDQAGQYHLHFDFIETGTACGTPGTGGVTFLLTWTDTNGTAHSAVSLAMDDSASIVATSGTFTFRSTLAAAWASGDFNISTNGSVIQYATGYTACSVGTGTYQLDAAVTKLQY